MPSYHRPLLTLFAGLLSFALASAEESDPGDSNPLMSSPGFKTTPGCEDKCDGVEDGATTGTSCDSGTFEGCRCVFADKYCVSECHDSGTWRMGCAGMGLPPSPNDEEVPESAEEPDPDNSNPLLNSPGFETTPGCEDKCNGVEDGATSCDSGTFEGCRCVFADKYCVSECDDSGAWLMACAGGLPPLPNDEEVPESAEESDPDPAETTADEDTACLVEEDCVAAASRMGMEFSSGLFPTSGCFSKNNKAYFSPGTEDEMTKADLPGVQERIYCDGAEAKARPDPEPEITLCLTESECDKARTEGGIEKFLTGDFPTHGCFKKSGKAYWGVGGSSEEISKEDLPGVQERIYCRGVSTLSSVVLSKASTESKMIVSGANVASLRLSILFAVAAFSSFR